MIKRDMELREDRAKRHSCHRFWYSLPERISRVVEHFFYRLGIRVARKPYKWILGCFVVFLFCLLGLIRFHQEKNPLKLWVPTNSDFVTDTEWLMSHSSEGLRVEKFILTGDNVLEKQTLIRLNEIIKQVISSRTLIKNISWTDVCIKVPDISGPLTRFKRETSFLDDNFFDDDFTPELNKTFEPAVHVDSNMYCSIIESLPMSCFIYSILDIWNFDSAKIEKDSIEEIITKINTVKVSPTLGHIFNFSELLGNVTLDDRGRIIAATAIRTDLMVHVKFINIDMDKIGNMAGTADWVTEEVWEWEGAYLEVLKNISNQLQSEKNINNSLKLYYEAGRSFGDISGTSIFQDLDKLFLGSFLMFLYVLTILSKHNWVEWRFCLTSTGIFSVGIAFILSVGICSLFGIPYGPVHTSLPFLLLGLGIDDIFVINASWKLIHTKVSTLNKPLAERIGLTLGHAGSAITITSLTDVVAFVIGASTILPSLQSYCIYAAMGVLVTFLLQITFFIACFTLDARRIEEKKNGTIPCIVHENFTPKPNMNSTISWKFINFLYSKIILTIPGKILVILITLVTLSISIVGLLQLQQWFDPVWLIPKESYFYKYLIVRNQTFPNEGYDAIVIMGDDIDYSSEFSKIISLTERLQNTSVIKDVEPWPIYFAKFVSTYYDTDLKTTKIADDKFHHYLSQFLVSRTGGKYQKNFFFKKKFKCGRIAPRIVAATIDFKFRRFWHPGQWIPAMDNTKLLTKEAQVHGYVTVWCKMFAPWTTDKQISQEVFRNIILALICVMGTTAILIAEIQTCCWIFLCVLLTLLNVCGFMYFWGLTIDIVSCIGLEIGIGLSVDYAAHVAHAFLNAESQENDDKTRRTRTLMAVRHIGAAVSCGAGSTFIAVSMFAFSSTYVFISFFRIFYLIILFGVWHGLFLLPVILSSIGPQSIRVIRQSEPMSEKVITATDNED